MCEKPKWGGGKYETQMGKKTGTSNAFPGTQYLHQKTNLEKMRGGAGSQGRKCVGLHQWGFTRKQWGE